MIRMTLSEYLRKPKDYRGEWTTERWDIPNWEEERKKYMGKRTLMTNIDGATCLVIEGLSLEIIDDTDWKKPDTVRKEISRQCLKFFTKRGIEPHYADCLIRFTMTLRLTHSDSGKYIQMAERVLSEACSITDSPTNHLPYC